VITCTCCSKALIGVSIVYALNSSDLALLEHRVYKRTFRLADFLEVWPT
jgi:hypothetical protein